MKKLLILAVLLSSSALAQEQPRKPADVAVGSVVGGGGLAVIALMVGAPPLGALAWALAGAGTTTAYLTSTPRPQWSIDAEKAKSSRP